MGTSSSVSMVRLYVLRATYLLMFVGLAVDVWPGLLRAYQRDLAPGVVTSMLTAVSLLAAVGIRYPLHMLPLMLFELVWKTIWLIAVALPLSSAGPMTPAYVESVKACLMGVIFLVVIPWPYVFARYVKQPGDPWRSS